MSATVQNGGGEAFILIFRPRRVRGQPKAKNEGTGMPLLRAPGWSSPFPAGIACDH